MKMDVLTDFYKRYGHEGGIAKVEYCPASLCIFKTNTVEVGLNLSFGASVAYRGRGDGRIVLSCTDTNIKESINLSDIDHFHGEVWAERVIDIIKKLPPKGAGVEMLFHKDVGENLLAPQILCAASAYAKLEKFDNTPQSLVMLVDKPPFYTASLISGRIAIVNISTKGFMTYNPNFEIEKVVVIKSGRQRKTQKLPHKYYEREYVRINAISNSVLSLGKYMHEASRDMLSYLSVPELDILFEECCNFTERVRVLPDLSGAVLIVDKEKIDELIMLVRSRYEKKTGLTPAFYVSD